MHKEKILFKSFTKSKDIDMILRDCDYILDKKDNFWIIKFSDNKNIYGNLVYLPDKCGKRFNFITKKFYSKFINKNQKIKKIKRSNIVRVFKPEKFFIRKFNSLTGVWKKIPQALIMSGIPKKDIGIFGSYLIGFKITKDVDFVVYGKQNCIKSINNIKKIRKFVKAKKISKKHIIYQTKKYSINLSKQNDFKNMLKNKWSSLQISPGVLSTLRFVYKKNEIPKNIKILKGKSKEISGKVINSIGTNFVPRIFHVINNKGEKIRFLTYFWAYQSCVKNNQKVKIFGEYNKKTNTIYLSKKTHWIKIKPQ